MNGFTRTPRRIGARCLLWLGLVVSGVGLLGFESSRSGSRSIMPTKLRRVDRASYRSWSEYLMGGPTCLVVGCSSALDASD